MMKPLSVLLVASLTCTILLTTCSTDKSQQSGTISDTIRTASSPIDNKSASDAATEENDTCIFNNDYKKLTMDWVKELNASGFVWHDNLRSAIKIIGQDTITLSQGGCYHFGISAEWSMVDPHPTADSVYWIEKALQLAKEYEFDDYVRFITDRRIVRQQGTDYSVLYGVVDTTSVTNQVYDGISIEERSQRKILSLSMYVN
jgi:hypothetical protein